MVIWMSEQNACQNLARSHQWCESRRRILSTRRRLKSLTQNTYHPILPFCYFAIRVRAERLKAFIIKKKGVKCTPLTLGEHLKKHRLTLGLRQEDVASHLGTLREVYERWERDIRMPIISEWPSLLRFLGYYPSTGISESEIVLKARRCQGFDQKTMASAIGVAPEIYRKLEKGSTCPSAEVRMRIMELAIMPHEMHPKPLE